MKNIVELPVTHGNEPTAAPSVAKSEGTIASPRHGPAGCPPSGSVHGVNIFLTPAELAARWRWHVETVRLWLRLKKLDSTRIGRRRLIPLESIEQLERSGLVRRAV